MLSDSLVVVVLEDRNPEETAVADPSWRADLFDLASGRVVARNLPLPGKVVEADSLLYVVARDSEHLWQVQTFRVELDQ